MWFKVWLKWDLNVFIFVFKISFGTVEEGALCFSLMYKWSPPLLGWGPFLLLLRIFFSKGTQQDVFLIKLFVVRTKKNLCGTPRYSMRRNLLDQVRGNKTLAKVWNDLQNTAKTVDLSPVHTFMIHVSGLSLYNWLEYHKYALACHVATTCVWY